MNMFRVIRRSLWGVLLALCIVVGLSYLALSQVFLTTSSITAIVKESKVAESVRNDVLLPQVLGLIQNTPYTNILDKTMVTDALNATATDAAIEQRLAPAIESTSLWLNSKQPNADFTIDMSDLSAKFAEELSKRLTTKIAALPTCGPNNTFADIGEGVCQSPLVNPETAAQTIRTAIEGNPMIAQSIAISSESTPIFSSIQRSARNLPTYLNILYSLSVMTTGLGIMITLWLLYRHRFAGIVTIGASTLFAAIGLFAISAVVSTTYMRVLYYNDPATDSLIETSVRSLQLILQQQATWLALGGVVAIAIGTVLLIIFKRRKSSHDTVHMSSS